LDRVLKRDRDLERYLGYQVRIAHRVGAQKQVLVGELSSFTDEVLVITAMAGGQPETHQIARDSIERVNLVPDLEF